MSKKILTTPISDEALAELNVGDIVYLTGHLVTCRDVAHRRLIELKQKLPVDIKDGAIFHAGPIVREKEDGSYEMVSIGPTTSMRMEKFERQFIAETGVKLIIGKGGMGEETAKGCLENKAVHAVFPGGCAVVAATKVEEIEQAEWKDLGMPETLWVSRVREFGPLIISIDSKGRNIFEENKKTFNERKGAILKKIHDQVKFIK
ncbi:L(+)-tartrate dehydratase subunit beta [Marinomonas sp. THO17]|uniref:L(+)-tartrate dehydratase subunit beta n=1 Tax=Marinomonas sp. THO17 TaxID=3149048 RepID=UPI00336BBBF8